MALEPHEEPEVGEQFLDILARDAEVRQRYIEAGDDEEAVAKIIAEHTGRDVEAHNLAGMARHLSQNRAEQCNQLAEMYPAMNLVVVSTQ
ncbi:MAG TPA: hypothetical protein VFH72_05410 [Candidatus Baltobacteraceae bacterium]|nr:hypothetical protein [Candidatus Baltobacteraceae bacterium]